tara:strand:- start:348 stop:764 length:417 start_codon:yes stop_codon:yes gene_type:complete
MSIYEGLGDISFSTPIPKGAKIGSMNYDDIPNYNIDFGQNRKQSRYSKFSDALSAAAKYRQKAKDKAIIEKKVKDDDKGTSGFKISDDAFVVEGYKDPGYTIPGQQGRSILGTAGALITPFAPITGQAIGAVGSLTGI